MQQGYEVIQVPLTHSMVQHQQQQQQCTGCSNNVTSLKAAAMRSARRVRQEARGVIDVLDSVPALAVL
jgi:hypothetical protein